TGERRPAGWRGPAPPSPGRHRGRAGRGGQGVNDREVVALITGAASGIGLATARTLAGAGVRVVLADVDADGGARAAEELGGHFIATDVSDLEANEAMVAFAVERYGGLDYAYLNAGVTSGCSLG